MDVEPLGTKFKVFVAIMVVILISMVVATVMWIPKLKAEAALDAGGYELRQF